MTHIIILFPWIIYYNNSWVIYTAGKPGVWEMSNKADMNVATLYGDARAYRRKKNRGKTEGTGIFSECKHISQIKHTIVIIKKILNWTLNYIDKIRLALQDHSCHPWEKKVIYPNREAELFIMGWASLRIGRKSKWNLNPF